MLTVHCSLFTVYFCKGGDIRPAKGHGNMTTNLFYSPASYS